MLHRAMRVAWCGRIVGETACARIDPTRQSRRCAARIAIQSQSRRDAMTSVNACASMRCAAGMTVNAEARARNRSLRHRANEYRRVARIVRADPPPSFDGDSESNDRFKRRAGYPGTAVNSMTRSGRRPWPGQYALPYIR
ncbi:hypothetical protein A3203_04240 [Burkholderia cenocepacia]|nr:hypothetical protein A3203_04240 [Burkholderia cenocepacia]